MLQQVASREFNLAPIMRLKPGDLVSFDRNLNLFSRVDRAKNGHVVGFCGSHTKANAGQLAIVIDVLGSVVFHGDVVQLVCLGGSWYIPSEYLIQHPNVPSSVTMQASLSSRLR